MSTGTHSAAVHAIRLAPHVSFSAVEYASQGNAILGIRDSGKSYSATLLAERLLDAGIPILAFDPIGVWHNLRCAGSGPGRKVIVAGGQHGDLAITPDTTEDIVRKALERGESLIIDLYDMALSKADWRRIVEKAVRLMLYENKGHDLRHIFIEEAAEFVPQMLNRDYAAVYSEIEKLARMGGNARLGYTLINQRAEQVNKAVLELCDCLFLHRQKGSRSLQALEKWLAFSGDDKNHPAKVVLTMPTLKQGECWVWQSGAKTPTRLQMPKKTTYHPNRREKEDAGQRLQVDVTPYAELVARPEKPAAKAKAAPAPEPIIQYVFRPGEVASLEIALQAAQEIANKIISVKESASKGVFQAHELIAAKSPVPATETKPQPTGDLSAGETTLLVTANTYYPKRLTTVQLGTLSGYTPSTVRTYTPKLFARGLLTRSSEGKETVWVISPAARTMVAHITPARPRDKSALLLTWMGRLDHGAGVLLKIIYEHSAAGHGPISMAGLAQKAGYTESTLRTYLPTLRNNRLIEKANLRISPDFLE